MLAREILMTDDDEATNPTLSDEHVGLLRRCGEVITLDDGEYLYRPGDRHEHFYAILDGEIQIIDGEGDDQRLLAELGRGKFLGEYGLLVGGIGLMTSVARGTTRLLRLPISALLELVASDAVLSETILRAFLLRRAILVGTGLGVKVLGREQDPHTRRLLEFLARSGVPHRLVRVEDAVATETLPALTSFAVGTRDMPLVVIGSRVLRRPSNAALAATLRLGTDNQRRELLDLLVVGAGPAGLAAAVNGGSEGLATAVVERTAPGGQASTSSRIENYVGFPAGISGADLAARAELQTAKFGAIIICPADAVQLIPGNSTHTVVLADGGQLQARCVVISSGARYRGLDLPHVHELQGVGVHYAATAMEARACREATVAIVGGGNSAGQAALFLAGDASRVLLIVRRGSVGETMSQYLVARIEVHPRIEVLTHAEVKALHGHSRLNGITVRLGDGAHRRFATSDLFLFTGASPHTSWLAGRIALDENGFALTGLAVSRHRRTAGPLETSVPGIYAVGDVRSGSVKRVSAAVGEGAMVLASVHQHLSGQRAHALQPRGPRDDGTQSFSGL